MGLPAFENVLTMRLALTEGPGGHFVFSWDTVSRDLLSATAALPCLTSLSSAGNRTKPFCTPVHVISECWRDQRTAPAEDALTAAVMPLEKTIIMLSSQRFSEALLNSLVLGVA